ncbi:MAG TPA: SDR family oxidoreductase [Candidatus Binatia bacterium]|nr:SDR family oxidoreductase [Candidatus Binatia bacterium]
MRAVSGEGAILITGSTGFIGRHVTRRLYQAGRRVIALARSQGGVPGTNRLKSLLGIPAGDNGLEMIESDLTQPGAGLGSSEVARLRANVHTVIHCAGDTSFFPQITADSRAIFIDAPLALLQALRPGRLERWCQLSTAFVCGRRGGAIFESEGTVGQKFHNPYEEIKLESEIALKEFCARFGIDLRILRPSVVIGPESSTQGGSPSSLLYQFIRLAATLSGRGKRAQLAVRIQGRPSAHFNIVPIEYVSAAIEVLSEQPAAAGGTFHLVVSQPPTQAAMLQMITSRVGGNGLRLIDERREPMLGASSLENRVARMLSPYREYLEQDVSFDDSAARSLLGPAGITCSRLDEKTIDDFVAMAWSQPCHRVPARSRRQERSRA